MRGGYFVEFGATNGIELSNPFLLEKKYNWRGILVEPARVWHNGLSINRGCLVDTRCVWAESGLHLQFNEVHGLSTLDTFSNSDMHSAFRQAGTRYQVETISLLD